MHFGINSALRKKFIRISFLIKFPNCLSAKCSFLEEEVRSGQQHAKTLLVELNAMHDSLEESRRQAQAERQRIGAFLF
jgi:hypothetical protein